MRRTKRSLGVWPAFTDMMSGILLAFLVILLAIVTTLNPEGKENVIEERNRLRKELEEATAQLQAMKAGLDECKVKLAEADKVFGVGRELVDELVGTLGTAGIAARANDSGNLEISADLLFPSGSADIPLAQREKVKTLGRAMTAMLQEEKASAKSVKSILVIGHTDSIGPWQENLDLSTRRASSLVRLWEEDLLAGRQNLMGACDIPKIIAAGVGEARLKVFPEEWQACENSSPFASGCKANRRIEIQVMPKKDSVVEVSGCP